MIHRPILVIENPIRDVYENRYLIYKPTRKLLTQLLNQQQKNLSMSFFTRTGCVNPEDASGETNRVTEPFLTTHKFHDFTTLQFSLTKTERSNETFKWVVDKSSSK